MIIWVFPKIGVPQNGWFIVENPIKMEKGPFVLKVLSRICCTNELNRNPTNQGESTTLNSLIPSATRRDKDDDHLP